MPENFQKAFIAVVIFIFAVFIFSFLSQKKYVECKSFRNNIDFNYAKDNPAEYIPKVYEINNSCIAVLQKKNKAKINPCTAMDHLFFNITLLNAKATDRGELFQHLDKAESAMSRYQQCRKQEEYVKWVRNFKKK